MHAADVVLGFDAPTGFTRAPSWGRHGGPLTLTPGAAGAVDVVRWAVPADPMGMLTSQKTTVAAMIPAGSFLGAQAIDLPFFGWTAIGYTGAYPVTQGKALLLHDATIDASYDVNGFYAAAGVAAMGGEGRLLYTGLSALNDAAKSVNGLYAADSCGMTGMSPRLVPNGDASCKGPVEIAAWDDASGPVVVDSLGDVFVEMSTFGGMQELRGFAAKTAARGAGAAAGDVMMDSPASARASRRSRPPPRTAACSRSSRTTRTPTRRSTWWSSASRARPTSSSPPIPWARPRPCSS